MKVIFSVCILLLVCTFGTDATVYGISTKTCSGSAELESYHGSRPLTIYNLKQNGLTDAIATSRMFTPPGRLMPTILRVTGNCCWELYQRYFRLFYKSFTYHLFSFFLEPIIADPEKRSEAMA